jgi:hypothetical protein
MAAMPFTAERQEVLKTLIGVLKNGDKSNVQHIIDAAEENGLTEAELSAIGIEICLQIGLDDLENHALRRPIEEQYDLL